MRDGLPYGAHGGHRLRHGIREKETADGRPQVFLSCLPAPRGGVCDGDTDNGVLTAHKRGGCGATRSAWRERVLGIGALVALLRPPPFFPARGVIVSLFE